MNESKNSRIFKCKNKVLNKNNKILKYNREIVYINTLKQIVANTKSLSYMFYNYKGTSINDLFLLMDVADINVTRTSKMFYACSNLISIPKLNTTYVTSMDYMFCGCNNLKEIPQLDTSNVTDMDCMFSGCRELEVIDITSMDKIQSSYRANYFCNGCYSLKKFIIRNMTALPILHKNSFEGCSHFFGTTHRTLEKTYNPEGLKDGRIYVPDNMVEQLKQAPIWNTVSDIIVPLSTLEE